MKKIINMPAKQVWKQNIIFNFPKKQENIVFIKTIPIVSFRWGRSC